MGSSAVIAEEAGFKVSGAAVFRSPRSLAFATTTKRAGPRCWRCWSSCPMPRACRYCSMAIPVTETSTICADWLKTGTARYRRGLYRGQTLSLKTNSFIGGQAQPLADIDEFCGKIKQVRTRRATMISIVARVEAFIAGWGLAEALKRAEAYRQAGADAILIHRAGTPDEVLAFKKSGPTGSPGDRADQVLRHADRGFRKQRFSLIIWANHLLARRHCRDAADRPDTGVGSESLFGRGPGGSCPRVFRLQGSG